MARTETLVNMRTRARQRADMVNSSFCSDAEVTGYVNESIAELYDLLVSKHGEDYYEGTTPATFSTTPGTRAYALPADYFKTSRICVLDSGGRERNLERFTNVDTDSAIPVNRAWSVRHYYVPCATKLSTDNSTFDGINGWEEYVIVDAAIKMLSKEESSISDLLKIKGGLLARINAISRHRDRQHGVRIQDTRATRKRSFWHRVNDTENLPLYRVKNGYIELIERLDL